MLEGGRSGTRTVPIAYALVAVGILGAGAIGFVADRIGTLEDPIRLVDRREAVIVAPALQYSPHSLRIRNTTQRELRVQSLDSSCVCIDPFVSPTVLPADAEARIHFRLVAPPGLSDQWVSLRVEGDSRSLVFPLSVQGRFEDGLLVSPNQIRRAALRRGIDVRVVFAPEAAEASPPSEPIVQSTPEISASFSGWEPIRGTRRLRGVLVLRTLASGEFPECVRLSMPGSAARDVELTVLP